MERYREPQIFIVNNKEIADRLSEHYNVATGNLGVNKLVKFRKLENKSYVNLEYNIVDNLHEYSVVIIDLQTESTYEYYSSSDQLDSNRFLYELQYPKKEFFPAPLVLNIIKGKLKKQSLKIIFASKNYTEKYNLVKVLNQLHVSSPIEKTHSTYEIIEANGCSKSGKKIIPENNKMANLILNFAKAYNVTFQIPKIWDSESQEYIIKRNFIPLLKNSEGEVISYIGYSETLGYELLLPVCDKKDELIDRLLTSYLPEILPKIFPESKEFEWIKGKEFCHSEIFEIEAERKALQEEYESKIDLLNQKIDAVNQKYKFLHDLLTATGEELVQAVCKYFEWLGFKDVQSIDGSEDILREDIQILEDDKIYIVEVKGISGTSTDSECSQVAKHRRRREKENPDKTIIPIYIVNHQRYINPSLRQNPPFSSDQVDYAKNDERGLLTTWQLYKQYKLIENKIFTKEETREALKDCGIISLIPKNLKSIGTYSEYFKKPKAGILILENIKIRIGDKVYAKKDEQWVYTKINSIQVNNKNVDYAECGEVGIVTEAELGNGYELFIK